jgi:hypothetical protein
MEDNQMPNNGIPSNGENMAEGGDNPRAGREMLVQLQQMIDTLATQAGPVMREVAAKAAELAAVAGEKAGPLAHKAAGYTEVAGQKLAARSKEMAADLRKSREGEAEGMSAEGVSDMGMSDSMPDSTPADMPNAEMGEPD